MNLVDIVLYIGAFILIWIGSGLTVRSIESIAKKLKINTFIVSFVILGVFTSLPEIFLAINATINKEPEVSVGNLLGGIIVLFLLLIPLIAISGKGAKIIKDIGKTKLLVSLIVISLPSFLLIDKTLGLLEGLIFLGAYSSLIFFVEKNGIKNSQEVKKKKTLKRKEFSWSFSFGRLILGSVLIFISSSIILENTLKLAEVLMISPFIVSLFLISIGTNLPEFTVGIRSILLHDKNLALGNYVGSAAANTLLFGFLLLINPNGILIEDSKIVLTLALVIVSLILFYIFTVSKKVLSRKEGFVLLLFYIAFCVLELSSARA